MVIDDEPNLLKILEALLTREGYDVYPFSSFDLARPVLDTEDFDVLVTDLSMPGKSGMDVLAYCREFAADLPVVMITAFGTVEAAVDALKAGAFDFVLKPFDPKELSRILKKAVESRNRRKREPAFSPISSLGVGPVPVPLFGSEPSTIELNLQVNRAAKHQSSVLITGEVGSGKRSIAYEIHRRSDRARKPFVQIHCEAVPEIFQMSELFGTEKGAMPMSLFTKPGALELANGGTLVLEEIGALSPEVQNALYSAMENDYFMRIGGAKRYPLDLRIMTTSSADIHALVQDGDFHSELFFKLSVETIALKPLRDRKNDITTHLLPYFIERACSKRAVPVLTCDVAAVEWFKCQDWPGNLGELERRVERAVNEAVSRGQKNIDSSLLVLK